MNDQNGKAIFYDEQIRDAVEKLLASKSQRAGQGTFKIRSPCKYFFDEPALAGFGSSVFISISSDEVEKCFEEVIEAVHSEGGCAGIHVCANADWYLVLGSQADKGSVG
jgi:hypothetical protein